MRIASFKTIRANRKTRLNYAYRAIERDMMSGDELTEATAAQAFLEFHTMSIDDMMTWANIEIEYRQMTD